MCVCVFFFSISPRWRREGALLPAFRIIWVRVRVSSIHGEKHKNVGQGSGLGLVPWL